MRQLLRVSLGLLLSLASSDAIANPRAIEADAKVIESLRANGSDLSKPHLIDFFFDFPEEEGARELCSFLEKEGFEPHLQMAPDREFYTCRAVRFFVPTLETMSRLTRRFEPLAKKYGGDYDGWGTPVVP